MNHFECLIQRFESRRTTRVLYNVYNSIQLSLCLQRPIKIWSVEISLSLFLWKHLKSIFFSSSYFGYQRLKPNQLMINLRKQIFSLALPICIVLHTYDKTYDFFSSSSFCHFFHRMLFKISFFRDLKIKRARRVYELWSMQRKQICNVLDNEWDLHFVSRDFHVIIEDKASLPFD